MRCEMSWADFLQSHPWIGVFDMIESQAVSAISNLGKNIYAVLTDSQAVEGYLLTPFSFRKQEVP